MMTNAFDALLIVAGALLAVANVLLLTERR